MSSGGFCIGGWVGGGIEEEVGGWDAPSSLEARCPPELMRR